MRTQNLIKTCATVLIAPINTGSAAALPKDLEIDQRGPYPFHPQAHRPHTRQTRGSCPSVNGTFSIPQYQLYPENADYDFKNCLLYMGSLFNASVAIYSPQNHTTRILTFENITHNPAYHLGGVGVDPYSGLVSIVVDAGDAFNTAGKNISGTNWIMQWDPQISEVVYRINLTETTGGKYGGFQDVEQDAQGNLYVVGTFPASIVRVSKGGKEVKPWFLRNGSQTDSGFGGLAAVRNSSILLANDNSPGQIVRFDMSKEVGTPVPVVVTPAQDLKGSDAIYLPPKYNDTVLLVANDATGVQVLRSKDRNWESAEFLGLVSNNVTEAQGGTVTAPIQMGGSIYMVEEFFTDKAVSTWNAGNRSSFPMVDITRQVEGLLMKGVGGWEGR